MSTGFVSSATMTVARSILLFVLAAVIEIGGAWLVWQGVREHRGWAWIGAGIIALGIYGFVATLQSDANFGRILAAYIGVDARFGSKAGLLDATFEQYWISELLTGPKPQQMDCPPC